MAVIDELTGLIALSMKGFECDFNTQTNTNVNQKQLTLHHACANAQQVNSTKNASGKAFIVCASLPIIRMCGRRQSTAIFTRAGATAAIDGGDDLRKSVKASRFPAHFSLSLCAFLVGG